MREDDLARYTCDDEDDRAIKEVRCGKVRGLDRIVSEIIKIEGEMQNITFTDIKRK